MTDPETLIEVIERWRTRGQDAHDCADELLTYYNDRFNRGGEGTAAVEATGWQSMETAPKDGTEVLVFDEGVMIVSSWIEDGPNGESGWYDCGIIDPPPTHWMTLPQPPQEQP